MEKEVVHKICSKCKESKEFKHFYKAKRGKYGIS